jgi:type VI secretion system Hcp family effector
MLQLKKLRSTILPFVLASALAPATQAAQNAFLLIPGIPGESVAEHYENWIEIRSFGQEFSRRSCGGITVAKELDRASPLLAVAAVNNQLIAQATLAVRKPGEGAATEFLRMVLSDSIVSSVSIQSSDATSPVTEEVFLLPRTVSITYRAQNPDGSAGAPITSTVTCIRNRLP